MLPAFSELVSSHTVTIVHSIFARHGFQQNHIPGNASVLKVVDFDQQISITLATGGHVDLLFTTANPPPLFWHSPSPTAGFVALPLRQFDPVNEMLESGQPVYLTGFSSGIAGDVFKLSTHPDPDPSPTNAVDWTAQLGAADELDQDTILALARRIAEVRGSTD